MIRIIILCFLYFCITGLWTWIQIKTFDFSKFTEEELEAVNKTKSQIYEQTGLTNEQIMDFTALLGFVFGWVLVPYMIIKRIGKFLTKGLTK